MVIIFKVKNNRLHSKKRNRILEIIRGSDKHPSADWIYEQMKREYPGVSLGTIYRNLKILEEDGLIYIASTGGELSHYDANPSLHHHITCEICGKIADIEYEIDSRIFNDIKAINGFEITSKRLGFHGICPECQLAKKKR
ncbi:MAG: transcriptional repressor [Candidatus Omnitrophota bacterium]